MNNNTGLRGANIDLLVHEGATIAHEGTQFTALMLDNQLLVVMGTGNIISVRGTFTHAVDYLNSRAMSEPAKSSEYSDSYK